MMPSPTSFLKPWGPGRRLAAVRRSCRRHRWRSHRAAAAAAQTTQHRRPDAESRILVVLQLPGGNDGINTLMPFADAGLPSCGPTLASSAETS